MKESFTDVLIVGAGPAGLLASLYLSELGVKHRVVDKLGTRALNGRADGFHVRTVEIWDSFGIANRLEEHGNRFREWALWSISESSDGIQRQRLETSIGEEISHKSTATFHQGFVEASLIAGIRQRQGPHVERGVEAAALSLGSERSNTDHPIAVTIKHLCPHEIETWHVGAHRKHEDGVFEAQQGMIEAFGDDPEDIIPAASEEKDQGTQEQIHAKYVVGADGGHSWLRHELGIPMEGDNSNSVWGVFDIVPITDFPDIRKNCTILSEHGTVLIIPRENGFVRIYVQLPDESPVGETTTKSMPVNDGPFDKVEQMLTAAKKIFAPYKMDYQICDWWTVYKVGHRVATRFSHENRIFLVGDAVHTHTPKGGQGMNVSQQDSYNLAWKLAGVLNGQLDSKVLSTYESERRPIAKDLIDLDAAMSEVLTSRVKVPPEFIRSVYDRLRQFGSGAHLKYGPGLLVSEETDSNYASGQVTCGMRLPNTYIYRVASGERVAAQSLLKSDGSWYLFVLAGELTSSVSGGEKQLLRVNRLGRSLSMLSGKISHMSLRKSGDPFLRVVLCAADSLTDLRPQDLDPVYLPSNAVRGYDYNTIFSDCPGKGANLRKLDYNLEAEGAHRAYGVDRQNGGILLMRPDQIIAWRGSLDDFDGLQKMLMGVVKS